MVILFLPLTPVAMSCWWQQPNREKTPEKGESWGPSAQGGATADPSRFPLRKGRDLPLLPGLFNDSTATRPLALRDLQPSAS